MHPRTLRLKRVLVPLILLAILATSALPALADPTPPAQPAVVLWHDIDERSFAPAGERWIIPQQYRLVELNVAALQDVLAAAPLERTPAAAESDVVLELPLPEGGFGRFRIVESPVMEPELAAKFPEITTYAGQGLDDPTATARLDWTPLGFHGIIFGLSGTVYIDPFSRNDVSRYISYYAHDFTPGPDDRFVEAPLAGADAQEMQAELADLVAAGTPESSVTEQRRYRLAVAATGEYTQFYGGTVSNAMSGITWTINRVYGIYQRELAVQLVLIYNNDLIVYTDPNTDPYTGNDPGAMLSQNQSNLDAVIGSDNYDIGHVFSRGGGGLASFGVVCQSGWKAQGATGRNSPAGDPFDVDYVAHEIGHQFGGNHTFNGDAGSCAGNRNATTAFEPGSGSTIMAYAGVCGAQNLQPNSDDYFHFASLGEIVAYTTTGAGNTCAAVFPTFNHPPVVTVVPGNFTIPSYTPFTLTGSASDEDDEDTLTYNWEQYNLGYPGPPNNPSMPPHFRSWPSVASPERTFPRLSDLVNNSTVIGEVLPYIEGWLVFRLTVRDNHSGFGSANKSIWVTKTAGPFAVTAPNTAAPEASWIGLTTETVTWNVANTDVDPVNCTAVNIDLSTDGGYTYPTALASNTPNDGTEDILVPNITTTTARVRVSCANNIFFDISNANFSISEAPLAVTLASFGAEAQTDHVLVSWETTSEIDNAGFNLYRGDSPDGGDRELLAYVPSQAPGSSLGASYSYADSDVQTGQTYYYWLDAIDLAGAATTYGPVVVEFNVPTAVTVSWLAASPMSSSALPLAGAALALLLPLAGGLAATRRRNT